MLANGYLRAKIKSFGSIGNTEGVKELQFYKQKNADREFFSETLIPTNYRLCRILGCFGLGYSRVGK